MLLDFGWSELLLIGIVALVFVGPKDLPKAMRVAGYWIRKARSLSREFQSSIDQMIREAELDDIRRDLKKAGEFDIDHEFRRTIDPTGSLEESLRPPELPDFSQREPTAATAGEASAASGGPEAPPLTVAEATEGEMRPSSETEPTTTTEPPPETPPPISVADDDVAYDVVSPKR